MDPCHNPLGPGHAARRLVGGHYFCGDAAPLALQWLLFCSTLFFLAIPKGFDAHTRTIQARHVVFCLGIGDWGTAPKALRSG